jgi:hypothetical protein
VTVRRGIADLLEKLEEGKYWLTKVVDCTLSTFPEALGLSYLKLHNQFHCCPVNFYNILATY